LNLGPDGRPRGEISAHPAGDPAGTAFKVYPCRAFVCQRPLILGPESSRVVELAGHTIDDHARAVQATRL